MLLAVNSTANTLSIVPLETPTSGTAGRARRHHAHAGRGLGPWRDRARAARSGQRGRRGGPARRRPSLRRIPLPDNSGATGSAVVDDSIAYVGNPNLNTVSRVNYLTGETTEVPVGVYPQGVIFTRGRIFVLNGNLDETFNPAGPSWITVIDPVTNQPVPENDSIPLTGPGNAGFADVGRRRPPLRREHRQLLRAAKGGSRSWIRSALTEVASFAGLGSGPQAVAAQRERIFVSSFAEGLLEFNADSNEVVRGAGEGVPIPSNAGVAADRNGRVYADRVGPLPGRRARHRPRARRGAGRGRDDPAGRMLRRSAGGGHSAGVVG